MKLTRLLLGIMVIAGLVGFVVQPVSAAGFTYFTGFQVQNLDASAATVTINFIDSAGVVKASVPDTIDANASKTYYPLPPSVPNNFNGSVVISSNTRLASVVNIQATSPSNVAASYVGASSGNTSVLLPLLMKGNAGTTTWISVQNVGNSPTNLSMQYSDIATPFTANNVPAGASFVFKQADEAHPLKVFSAVVTSSAAPVAATVVEEGPSYIMAYSGFSGGATNPVMPLINVQPAIGIQTGVQILNNGNTDSTVTLSYTPGQAGTACTETQTIVAHQSATFTLFPFAGAVRAGVTSDCTKSRFVGSAKVTANSAGAPLAAVVNQLKGTTYGEAYGAFDTGSATNSVVLPLILDRRGAAAQLWTGFSIMNVSGGTTDISCTFTNSTYTASATGVANGASLIDQQKGKIAANYAGSATCTSTGKIVGVVNEISEVAPGDNFMVYEAITK